MSFGQKLRDLRKEKGLTISQMTMRTGLNSGYISQVERNHRSAPKYETLLKFAKGLEVDEDTILQMAGINSHKIPSDLSENQVKVAHMIDKNATEEDVQDIFNLLSAAKMTAKKYQ